MRRRLLGGVRRLVGQRSAFWKDVEDRKEGAAAAGVGPADGERRAAEAAARPGASQKSTIASHEKQDGPVFAIGEDRPRVRNRRRRRFVRYGRSSPAARRRRRFIRY